MIPHNDGSDDRIDISVVVRSSTPEWPGDTPYSCGWSWSMSEGATVNVSSITTSPHVGTHADAPIHVRQNTGGAETLPLAAFDGPAYVLRIGGEPRDVTWAELAPLLPTDVQRLLVRTDRTVASGTFPDDWPALSAECLSTLVARGLVLLGTDAPSVDRRTSTVLGSHHALFDGGACNLESLDLRVVADGWYSLSAYPIRLDGLDAAPVRAVLRPLRPSRLPHPGARSPVAAEPPRRHFAREPPYGPCEPRPPRCSLHPPTESP